MKLTLRNSVPLPDQPAVVSVELGEGEQCLIGRSRSARIVCNTGAISREHCVLEVIGGELWLRVLPSSGGTYLDGQKVMRAKLGVGAVIYAGQARIDVLELESFDD